MNLNVAEMDARIPPQTSIRQMSRELAPWCLLSFLLHLMLALSSGAPPASISRPLPQLQIEIRYVEPDPETVLSARVPDREPLPISKLPPPIEQRHFLDAPATKEVKTDPLLSYLLPHEVDTRAILVNEVDLIYPEKALVYRLHGRVVLMLLINESGSVDRVQIVEAEPKEIFDKAAIDAAMALRYKPAVKLGQPVKSRRTIEVNFDPYDADPKKTQGGSPSK